MVIPDRYVVWRRSTNVRELHLTFDDGPSPEHTPPVLDALDHYGAHGTFFLVAEKAARHPDIVRDILARGHSIGCHTYSHRKLVDLHPQEYPVEIDRAHTVLDEIAGRETMMFRPPWGAFNTRSMVYLLRQGLRVVFWSVDSIDYHRRSEGEVIENAKCTQYQPGDIILLHDDNPYTVAAVPSMIEVMRTQNFQLTRL